jgi:hypothetical protein
MPHETVCAIDKFYDSLTDSLTPKPQGEAGSATALQ